MNPWLDTVLVLLILTNLHLLGSSRISACIRTRGRPGGAAGHHLAAGAGGRRGASAAVAGAVSTVIKAGVLALAAAACVREAGVQTEVEPIVGFTTSLLLGLGLLGAALHVAGRLPLPGADGTDASSCPWPCSR